MCKVMEDMRNEAAKNAVEKDRTKNAGGRSFNRESCSVFTACH